MRVVITGITGFLGAGLARALIARGHKVAGTSTRGASTAPWLVTRHRLGDPVPAALFDDCAAVIHAAHDLSRGAADRNVQGTRALLDAALARGITNQVYISSYSAHEGAVTEYGRVKRALEPAFLEREMMVVRPGLVLGKGGLFERIADAVQGSRILPVIAPNALVPVIAAPDLYTCIVALLTDEHDADTTYPVALYLDERVTMRALVRAVCTRLGARPWLVPVSYSVAMGALGFAAALGVKLPIDADNVRALQANQSVIDPGDLYCFMDEPIAFPDMLY